MGWWLARTLSALLVVAIGALVGAMLGTLVHATVLALLAGALAAVMLLVLRDSWRGQGLMDWLRGPLTTQAPRDTGFWGELGYRTERALRVREQAAQQEQERLAQFLSAIEASPNGVLLLDAADQIEWCNSVAAEHFGLDPLRDRRQRVTNLVRMPAFVAHLQAGRFDEAVVFSGPLGRTTLSVLVRPYGDGLKLVLTQDITERERTEAMRRDFVANVSHEIRTPLTVLAGFVETMGQLPLTDTERARVLPAQCREFCGGIAGARGTVATQAGRNARIAVATAIQFFTLRDQIFVRAAELAFLAGEEAVEQLTLQVLTDMVDRIAASTEQPDGLPSLPSKLG